MKIYGDENCSFIQKEIGLRIKDIRIRQNLKQSDLAQKAGVSSITVTRIERGDSVNLTNLILILRALGLSGNLELLIPEQELTPQEILKNKSKPKRVSGVETKNANDWVWGDDNL